MPIDYSRFDNIDVSDDEDEQAYKARKEAEEAGRREPVATKRPVAEAQHDGHVAQRPQVQEAAEGGTTR